MILYIKNMVCVRCKMLVKKILDDLGCETHKVDLGYVELKQPVSAGQKEAFKEFLQIWGLELIEDNNEILVEKIKSSIMNMIHNDDIMSPLKTSHYLSHYLNYNYTYLANVFSQETGTCLRDFIIAHKIEKVKEMLIYDGLTISEIAWKLNYSSVAHLSNQFNKITGLRPSQFKKENSKFFIPLEQIGMLEAV
ncbi:MAG: AraC family transcriptional regulator [Ferruginibacter sp.]|nr:AraC family transcriptional regulator [Ferruginibacter sp.]